MSNLFRKTQCFVKILLQERCVLKCKLLILASTSPLDLEPGGARCIFCVMVFWKLTRSSRYLLLYRMVPLTSLLTKVDFWHKMVQKVW